MTKQHPELIAAAEDVANLTAFAINQAANRTLSEMRYRAQAILENVIQILQQRV